MLQQPRIRVSLDLLPNSQVIHISGERDKEGVTFAYSDLVEIDKALSSQMVDLENTINISNYDENDALLGVFRNTVARLGSDVYLRILADKVIRDAFINATRTRPGAIDLAVSFKINKDFISLPLEFMLDESQTPLATRMPFYKTLTTPGYNNTQKPDLSLGQELNILLVSSDTWIGISDKIMMGTSERYPNFALPAVPELDAENSEIDEIEKIANDAKRAGKWKDVNIYKMHTKDAGYDDFIKEISSNKYNIIHYNGHGRADFSKNSSQNYMFVWKGNNKQSPVVAINATSLSSSLQRAANLQFVYLSCCQGAPSDERAGRFSNSFTGLLDAVVLAGVPNVLGMRWPVSVENSKTFAKFFYRALLIERNVDSVELALKIARSQVLGERDYSVWCSPILIKQQF